MKNLKDNPSLKPIYIIEEIVNSTSGITLNEISKNTTISKSTVHRILNQLLNHSYVLRKADSYYPGPDLTRLAYKVTHHDPIIYMAHSAMNKLNDKTSETINLIGLSGFEGIYLDKVHAVNRVGLRSKIGWSIPLHCTSGGKSLLAFQTKEWLDDFFKYGVLEKYTENTITDVDKIRAMLEEVRTNGYALDVNEHNQDIVCIGAPILGPSGTAIAAISISAPEYRFPLEKALSYKELLIQETTKLTGRII